MGSITTTNPKVWASLITNLDYVPGLLTLSYSLQQANTKYPFVAFYTESFPDQGVDVLKSRGITTQLVPTVTPTVGRAYEEDLRFREAWKKLVVFSLIEYERIVLLDGDMLVRRNMDELMDVELDLEKRVIAASHACACNPLKKDYYPSNWSPENCAFTSQHSNPDKAQLYGASCSTGVGMLNSGLIVVRPSEVSFAEVQEALQTPSRIAKYEFADQGLLSDVFSGRWAELPYVYNALKSLRWEGVHSAIWRDAEVKNVHYIFAKKPWHEPEAAEADEPNRWWWITNRERQQIERARGITDGY
ncbi:hypothetical protein ASPWEDRAFT_29413 [Aspergillus wentii DTO 134E9]|uniref:Glycosyl transferase family 8 C-terminal domain-containing protein n=1 Tax=Aspergillus wentii DTO 134E9 TaxID=1073089 RepID=A0A1L9RH37_ASPWE|nr:uncharacterized protein ASPWEDRAFT_29413 [Aspergillus wentii DTO 134E9]OJJ34250.1 hypothetical protein ASPWEDRAFT_29413 [Aspergillus wentii DTO 134E9]